MSGIMPAAAVTRERRQTGTIPFTPTAESAPVNLTSRACGTALFLTTLLLASAATADDTVPTQDSGGVKQPLWEIGVAAGAGVVPDYPGSDRYRARVIPFPYFVYRGHLFRSDENGARLRADVRPDVELDVSGGASFSTHSDASGPRAGMPDLDYLLELGPNLKITFDRPSPTSRWLLELPVRVVVSTNGSNFGYRGLIFNPLVGIQERSLFGSRWSGYASAGPEFTTARFQQYFYQVDPQYARPDRPAYSAHGGYFGSRLELGVSHKIGRDVRVFFYGRLDDYNGARNDDSPLLKAKVGYSAFVGFSWAIWHSDATVPVVEERP